MLPAWLVWSTVGYLAKDFLPIPGLAKPPPAPASPPPQQPFVGFVPNAIQHEPPQLVLRAPIDPALPMDPGIDEETERAVLKALQDENVKDILGFAQSISHQGDPQAASMLRYHARLVQQAKTAMGIAETQAKETQAKETQNRETPKTPAPTPTPPPPSETPTEPAPPDSEEPVEETTKTAKARAKNGAAVAKA